MGSARLGVRRRVDGEVQHIRGHVVQPQDRLRRGHRAIESRDADDPQALSPVPKNAF